MISRGLIGGLTFSTADGAWSFVRVNNAQTTRRSNKLNVTRRVKSWMQRGLDTQNPNVEEGMTEKERTKIGSEGLK